MDSTLHDPLTDVADWDAAAEQWRTPCGEGEMVWRVWGQGRAVLLLHGGSGSWQHWIRTLPALTGHCRVFVPDLPGLGESAMPPAPFGPEGVAIIVARGIEQLLQPDESFDVVGFSFGATIAGLVASHHKERCGRLVLVGAGGLGLPRSDVELEKVRDKQGEARRAAHRINLQRLMFALPENIDEPAMAIQEWNTRHARVKSVGFAESTALLDALAESGATLRAIWGAEDAVARATLAERCAALRRLDPAADIRIIPSAGHWVAYEAADAFNEALVAMLCGD